MHFCHHELAALLAVVPVLAYVRARCRARVSTDANEETA